MTEKRYNIEFYRSSPSSDVVVKRYVKYGPAFKMDNAATWRKQNPDLILCDTITIHQFNRLSAMLSQCGFELYDLQCFSDGGFCIEFCG